MKAKVQDYEGIPPHQQLPFLCKQATLEFSHFERLQHPDKVNSVLDCCNICQDADWKDDRFTLLREGFYRRTKTVNSAQRRDFTGQARSRV